MCFVQTELGMDPEINLNLLRAVSIKCRLFKILALRQKQTKTQQISLHRRKWNVTALHESCIFSTSAFTLLPKKMYWLHWILPVISKSIFESSGNERANVPDHGCHCFLQTPHNFYLVLPTICFSHFSPFFFFKKSVRKGLWVPGNRAEYLSWTVPKWANSSLLVAQIWLPLITHL